MQFDQQYLDDLKAIVKRIKDNFSLCEFAGKTETEYMVAETVHAACLNFKDHGQPFSFKGEEVRSVGGGMDNDTGYQICLDRGWFYEEPLDPALGILVPKKTWMEDGKVIVIFPTRKLLDDLNVFFANKK